MSKTKRTTTRMGRPASRPLKPGEPIMVSFKLDGGLVRRLDAVARRWMEERPGTSATRSEVARHAIVQWLEANAPAAKE